MIVILMGVSGAGKTTIGHLLSKRLGWRFLEGDDLHSVQNRNKMQAGIPLCDDDRMPWLEAIAYEIGKALRKEEHLIVACSALKEAHRQCLRKAGEGILFVHLRAPQGIIQQRIESRSHPFMSPHLLESQFLTLESPADALDVCCDRSTDAAVNEIENRLRSLIE